LGLFSPEASGAFVGVVAPASISNAYDFVGVVRVNTPCRRLTSSSRLGAGVSRTRSGVFFVDAGVGGDESSRTSCSAGKKSTERTSSMAD